MTWTLQYIHTDLIDSVARDHVPETNGAERDEAEVETIQKVPALPLPKDDRTPADVADHHRQAQADRHSNLQMQ